MTEDDDDLLALACGAECAREGRWVPVAEYVGELLTEDPDHGDDE